jgi:hypothetical protein
MERENLPQRGLQDDESVVAAHDARKQKRPWPKPRAFQLTACCKSLALAASKH